MEREDPPDYSPEPALSPTAIAFVPLSSKAVQKESAAGLATEDVLRDQFGIASTAKP